ncbi:MAG: hypothetical protein HUU45_06600 [Leptospiraceae bacterium]|nr:hypothetical protein [Leptospiraceae bacterium]
MKNVGSVSSKEMEKQVKLIYEEFDQKRKTFEAQQSDLDDLKNIEEKIKRKK